MAKRKVIGAEVMNRAGSRKYDGELKIKSWDLEMNRLSFLTNALAGAGFMASGLSFGNISRKPVQHKRR